ncbi:hypothetical protein JW905_12575 [bacterium]|nr:hypothetical protein [candidate division CSSED10-310 bacterium]
MRSDIVARVEYFSTLLCRFRRWLQTQPAGLAASLFAIAAWCMAANYSVLQDIIYYDGAHLLDAFLHGEHISLVPDGYYLFPRVFTGALLLFLSRLFGTAPLGYHAVGLMLHMVNAGLFFFLAWRILGEPTPALLVALCFSGGPHTEVVGLIGAISELLVVGCCAGCLLAWFRFRDSGSAGSFLAVWMTAWSACFFRDTAVVLPGMLLLDYLLRPSRSRSFNRGALALLTLGWLPVVAALSNSFSRWLTAPPRSPTDQSLVQGIGTVFTIADNAIIGFFHDARPVLESLSGIPLFPLLCLLGVVILSLPPVQPRLRRLGLVMCTWCLIVNAPYAMLQFFSSNYSYPAGYGYAIIPFLWIFAFLVWSRFRSYVPRLVRLGAACIVLWSAFSSTRAHRDRYRNENAEMRVLKTISLQLGNLGPVHQMVLLRDYSGALYGAPEVNTIIHFFTGILLDTRIAYCAPDVLEHAVSCEDLRSAASECEPENASSREWTLETLDDDTLLAGVIRKTVGTEGYSFTTRICPVRVMTETGRTGTVGQAR